METQLDDRTCLSCKYECSFRNKDKLKSLKIMSNNKQILDINFHQIDIDKRIPQFPKANICINKQEYLVRCLTWKNEVEILFQNSILPIPVSLFFHRPNIPNMHQRISYIVKSSSNHDIRMKKTIEVNWRSTLVPFEPIPQLYSNYSSFESAYIRWVSNSSRFNLPKSVRSIFNKEDVMICYNILPYKTKPIFKKELNNDFNYANLPIPNFKKISGLIFSLLCPPNTLGSVNYNENKEYVVVDADEFAQKQPIKTITYSLTIQQFKLIIMSTTNISYYSKEVQDAVFLFIVDNIDDPELNFIFMSLLTLQRMVQLCLPNINQIPTSYKTISIIFPMHSNGNLALFFHNLLAEYYYLCLIIENICQTHKLRLRLDHIYEQIEYFIQQYSSLFPNWFYQNLNQYTSICIGSIIQLLLFYSVKKTFLMFHGKLLLFIFDIINIDKKSINLFWLIKDQKIMFSFYQEFTKANEIKVYCNYFRFCKTLLHLNIKYDSFNWIFPKIYILFVLNDRNSTNKNCHVINELIYSIVKFASKYYSKVKNWSKEIQNLFIVMIDQIGTNIFADCWIIRSISILLKFKIIYQKFLKNCIQIQSVFGYLCSSINENVVAASRCLINLFLNDGQFFSSAMEVNYFHNSLKAAFLSPKPELVHQMIIMLSIYMEKKIPIDANSSVGTIFQIPSLEPHFLKLINFLGEQKFDIFAWINFIKYDNELNYMIRQVVRFENVISQRAVCMHLFKSTCR